VSESSNQSNNAKALEAVRELIQSKLLSAITVEYLTQVRDRLQAEIERECALDDESVWN
jgi:hypothetical protein